MWCHVRKSQHFTDDFEGGGRDLKPRLRNDSWHSLFPGNGWYFHALAIILLESIWWLFKKKLDLNLKGVKEKRIKAWKIFNFVS